MGALHIGCFRPRRFRNTLKSGLEFEKHVPMPSRICERKRAFGPPSRENQHFQGDCDRKDVLKCFSFALPRPIKRVYYSVNIRYNFGDNTG